MIIAAAIAVLVRPAAASMSDRPWLRWGPPWVGLALGAVLAVSGVRLATTSTAPIPEVGTVPSPRVPAADVVGPAPWAGSAPQRLAMPTIGHHEGVGRSHRSKSGRRVYRS